MNVRGDEHLWKLWKPVLARVGAGDHYGELSKLTQQGEDKHVPAPVNTGILDDDDEMEEWDLSLKL